MKCVVLLLVWTSAIVCGHSINRVSRAAHQVCHPTDGRLFEFHTRPLLWEDAQIKCEENGGQLATIQDTETFEFIKSQILGTPEINDDVKTGMWIGLNDRSMEGLYEWVDGTPLQVDDFKLWSASNPNNNMNKDACHGQDCVQMWKRKNWLLDDDYCSFRKKDFICEYFNSGECTAL
ncbi:lectin BRA-3-like [Saccoglossus kowalevskii]|uniref:C-type lectin domain family 17, member A-like n=1 Tax=Saccoglossus kowalevskii TaxID=10224 RepID=A0ABM0H1P6_SACKO|nr:PREDICTED: C-type lectin domain family 17, member A-like [Saccoglossus kowalevskii]